MPILIGAIIGKQRLFEVHAPRGKDTSLDHQKLLISVKIFRADCAAILPQTAAARAWQACLCRALEVYISMLTKFAIMLTLASAVAIAMRWFGEATDEAVLRQEVAGQIDELRARLLRR
jgi:hypothetical protein